MPFGVSLTSRNDWDCIVCWNLAAARACKCTQLQHYYYTPTPPWGSSFEWVETEQISGSDVENYAVAKSFIRTLSSVAFMCESCFAEYLEKGENCKQAKIKRQSIQPVQRDLHICTFIFPSVYRTWCAWRRVLLPTFVCELLHVGMNRFCARVEPFSITLAIELVCYYSSSIFLPENDCSI